MFKLIKPKKKVKNSNKSKLNIGRAIKVYIKKFKHKTTRIVDDAKIKVKDIPKTNFSLGKYHMVNGNIKDAIFRFKLVSMLRPDDMEAFYYLGRSHILAGNEKKAQKAFDKLTERGILKEEVQYFLDRFGKPEEIRQIPKSMVKEICNVYFAYYRNDYLNKGYLGHKIMVSDLFNQIDMANNRLNILDLGCGYGQCGLLLKQNNLNNKITGIDLSTFAIKQSSQMKLENSEVYANVHNVEITDFLSNNDEKFDIILADRSINLTGDLDHFAKLVKNNLNESGKFAVIFDYIESESFKDSLDKKEGDNQGQSPDRPDTGPSPDTEPSITTAYLPATQEFLFSDKFIRSTFSENGFNLKLYKKINVIENIEAGLYIFSL